LHSRNGVVKFQSGPVSPPVSSRLVSSRNRNNVVIFDGESRSSKFLCPFIVNREDEARGYPESRSRSRIKPSRENERQAESSRKMRERERERERNVRSGRASSYQRTLPFSVVCSLFGRATGGLCTVSHSIGLLSLNFAVASVNPAFVLDYRSGTDDCRAHAREDKSHRRGISLITRSIPIA